MWLPWGSFLIPLPWPTVLGYEWVYLQMLRAREDVVREKKTTFPPFAVTCPYLLLLFLTCILPPSHPPALYGKTCAHLIRHPHPSLSSGQEAKIRWVGFEMLSRAAPAHPFGSRIHRISAGNLQSSHSSLYSWVCIFSGYEKFMSSCCWRWEGCICSPS